MTEHSSLVGGSSVARVIKCAGSINESKNAPPQEASVYANEGSMLHDAIALVLDGTLSDGDLVGFLGHGHELTESLYQEMIVPALDFFDQELDEPLLDMKVEQRVGFQSIPGAFGTADVIGYTKDRAVVLDWKFGRGVPVEAENNQQGLFYAAAAMEDPKTSHFFQWSDDIEIIICQPAFEPVATRWVTNKSTVRKFVIQLKAALSLAKHSDAPLVVGDHCRWCPARSFCRKLTGEADEALERLEHYRQLNPQEMAELLEKAEILERYIDALRDMAHLGMENGIEIPGWKLVNKRPRRQWVDNAEASVRDYFRRSKKVTISDAYNQVFKSPAQIEKALKTAGLDSKMFASYTESRSSGTTLAKESDSRPAVPQLGGAIKRLQENLN